MYNVRAIVHANFKNQARPGSVHAMPETERAFSFCIYTLGLARTFRHVHLSLNQKPNMSRSLKTRLKHFHITDF